MTSNAASQGARRRGVAAALLAAAGPMMASGAVVRTGLGEEHLGVNATAVSLVELAKPIRIARGGATVTPQPSQEAQGPSKLSCRVTAKVHSASDKSEVCPKECPFFAQDRNDKDFCTFACVSEPQCSTYNPHTQIGDKKLGVCRSCVVDGCEVCDHTVLEDRCATCQGGYVLKEDGLCHFKYFGDWVYYLTAAIVVILALVVIWVLDMHIRPCTNETGLAHGLEARERMKLHKPKDSSGERPLWPLTTNLMTRNVAGPGMMLHFNFQFALILWALFVAIVWMCFAHFVDPALWILGTRRFGTPRMNCILVAWGYETQNRFMWTKVSFLAIVYVGSLLMCFLYGVYQLRAFQDCDYTNKTMKDFVAMIVDLPSLSGEKAVEEDLKTKIEEISGQPVVGVSVAWDYQEYEEDITKALDADVEAMDPNPEPEGEPEMNAIRRAFYNIERSLFGLSAPPEEAGGVGNSSDEEQERDPIDNLLRTLRTSPRAFAVFPTQESMEAAVDACKHGFEFEGASGLKLETLEAEPDTVQWQNFGHAAAHEKALKLVAGFGIITLACLFWAIVFYSPYAYYVMTFNYENGRQPGFAVGFAFSMIVVVGNAIMYEVCAQISDWVGFRFKDNREACYMILYTVACMFNVGLDFVTTYRTAELVMEGLGFRNYFGIPLKEVTEFTAKFETYGMQRSLAENTYAYAFPSTFLIPFLIEPIPAIGAPLWIGRLIVRSHPEVQGRDAEDWVAMAEMEMGRYADLLLNTILGILIFYFPGGYTWKLFLGMAGSHCYIYIFDHLRVLRSVPSCMFASFDIEWWAQALMAPIVGIIASCLVFKMNCEPGAHCLKGPSLIIFCCMGWVLHVVVHICMLKFVIPKFGKPPPEEDPEQKLTFEIVCQRMPCSWFTSNPVHCLRSKHFYSHKPACSFFKRGREYLLRANDSIGCYYEEEKEA